jgi:hypothetical protein
MCRFTRLTGVALPITQKTIYYQDINTGDLLLFSSRSSDATLIAAWTDEIFSHIALCYKDPETHEVYAWNADIQTKVPCVIQKKCCEGVQLQKLKTKIKKASGYVYWLPLRAKVKQWSEEWMRQWAGTPFRHNLWDLAHAAMPLLVPQRDCDFTRQMYCTELVALTLRCDLGMLKGQCSPLNMAKQAGAELSELRLVHMHPVTSVSPMR